MAYIGFLLSIIVCFATTNEACAKQSEKYEDLIYQSMKSIVTLDELVTTLSVQVASLTTSLSSMQVKVEQIEKQNARLFTSLEKVNERITNESNEVTAAFKTTQNNLKKLNTGIGDLESSFQARGKTFKTDMASLRTSIANIDAKVEKANKEVVVVSGEASNGHAKCVKVCAGTTGRDTTNWLDHSSYRGVYSDVDMTSCGFVKVPTVTTSIEGTSNHWVVTGTSSVYNVQPSKFRIFLYDTHSDPRRGVARSRKWNVEWIAVGFTC